MKKLFKKTGRFFIDLEQKAGDVLKQYMLIVDNGYSQLGQLNSTIKKINNYYPNCEITVLTYEQRKYNLQRDFPLLNYIFHSRGLRPRKYQIALQMLKMVRKKYDSIILFSLDITPLIISLFFLKSKVILYNQWGEWWNLRFRNISEIFKLTYVKRKTRFNLKNLLKKIGLFFILLQRENEELLKNRILLIDNGYASFEQIKYSICRIKDYLPEAKISVLALKFRRELKDNFHDLDFIICDRWIIDKYSIAWYMFGLRKKKYDRIILLSLDITPIILSIIFMKSKMLLYNQWQQWWTLKLKPIKGYLMYIPRFIFNIITFIFLLINVSLIFLIKSFNVFKFNLSSRRT